MAVGGIGAEHAVACTDEVTDRYDAEGVTSTGFAGGIQPELETGDIVICDQILQTSLLTDDAEVRSINADLAIIEGGRAVVGSCLTVPSVVTDLDTKRAIGRIFGPSIIDMESYWVCRTANEKGVDYAVARVVLDTANQHLPGVVRHVAENNGGAVRYLGKHPVEWPAIVSLRFRVRKARAALAEYLLDVTTTGKLDTSAKDART